MGQSFHKFSVGVLTDQRYRHSRRLDLKAASLRKSPVGIFHMSLLHPILLEGARGARATEFLGNAEIFCIELFASLPEIELSGGAKPYLVVQVIF